MLSFSRSSASDKSSGRKGIDNENYVYSSDATRRFRKIQVNTATFLQTFLKELDEDVAATDVFQSEVVGDVSLLNQDILCEKTQPRTYQRVRERDSFINPGTYLLIEDTTYRDNPWPHAFAGHTGGTSKQEQCNEYDDTSDSESFHHGTRHESEVASSTGDEQDFSEMLAGAGVLGGPSTRWQCNDCDKTFDSKHGLAVHRGKMHKKEVTSRTAVKSDAPLPLPSDGQPSMQWHCLQCDKTFDSEHGLTVHNGMMHKKKVPAYTYERQDPFSNRFGQTGGPPKQWQCDQCSSAFDSEHGLAVHRGMMHKKEVPASTYDRSDPPWTKTRSGQTGGSTKQWQCDQCSSVFDTEHGLAVHRGMMHKKEVPASTYDRSVDPRISAFSGIISAPSTSEHGLAFHREMMHKKEVPASTYGRSDDSRTSAFAGHISAPSNQWLCDQCGRAFDTQHGLAVHRGRMHK